VSVKDRWIGPCEQILNVPITCRCYEPGKPSSWLPIEGGFTPTASMAGLGEKLGMDPQISQSARWGLCQEPFFLRAVALSITVEDFAKGYDVWGLPVSSVCVMLVGFSPAGCTSIRIVVTLGYE
jgi:hypothetical protein